MCGSYQIGQQQFWHVSFCVSLSWCCIKVLCYGTTWSNSHFLVHHHQADILQNMVTCYINRKYETSVVCLSERKTEKPMSQVGRQWFHHCTSPLTVMSFAQSLCRTRSLINLQQQWVSIDATVPSDQMWYCIKKTKKKQQNHHNTDQHWSPCWLGVGDTTKSGFDPMLSDTSGSPASIICDARCHIW